MATAAAVVMESIRGTRSVRIERRKKDTGLGFSIKGGTEHGIPIVVFSVERNGPAAKTIRPGDELISVNGISLQGVSHSNAVDILRNINVRNVIIHLRSNPILQETFTSFPPSPSPPLSLQQQPGSHGNTEEYHVELPAGWERKIDYKTDRPYYENHYTKTSTWVDPNTLIPCLLSEFKWEELPSGWEKFADQYGDTYYVDHNTQTTHWDSPRGYREQEQLTILREFLTLEKTKLKEKQSILNEKRLLVINKNDIIEQNETKEEKVQQEMQQEVEEEMLEDIMLLNEEVEELESVIKCTNYQLQQLNDILIKAQSEDLGEEDPYKWARIIAADLQRNFTEYKELQYSIHTLLTSLNNEGAPVQYMLQIKPHPQDKKEMNETIKWIHVLPDKITGKTNVEMRVENVLLINNLPSLRLVLQQLTDTCTKISEEKCTDWDTIMSQLINAVDWSLLKEDNLINCDNLREKLVKILEGIS